MIKIYLSSLGCAKNLVDSEMMLGLLQHHHFMITENPAEAYVIIINTCGFIADAKEESINTILALAEYKKHGNCKLLAVAGCLVQKYRQELVKALPEVDLFLGTNAYHLIAVTLAEKLVMQPILPLDAEAFYQKRSLLTPPYTAYLKIAEGCDNNCTYCLIPQLRGPKVSRTVESILAEAKILLDGGVRELILIAQDTTAYGYDIYGREVLPELLRKLAEMPFKWIRLLYSYPNRISDELLKVMASCPNICHYMDIPVQHVSKKILKTMGRGGSRQDIEAVIARIRGFMPDMAIRTTFMVGFPGEARRDVEELLGFVEGNNLTWAGVFRYCREEDTSAALMPHQVRESTKIKRYNELMELLALVGKKQKAEWLGKVMEVLLEEPSCEMPGFWQARSQYHAPDVDGVVYVRGTDYQAGEFVKVKITDADSYDLFAEPIVIDDK